MKGAQVAVVLLVIGLCQVFGQTCADPNCITCPAGPYNCTACQGSYQLDYKSFCLDCGDVYGYYFNTTTRKCEACKQAKCLLCNANACLYCYQYYGVNTTTNLCVGCPPHAQTCHHNTSFNYMQVDRCDDNYYQNDTSHCIACPSNLTHCIQCQDYDSCLDCDTGYYVDQTTERCVACSDHCIDCQGGFCNTCEDGYEVDFFTGNCSTTTCSSAFCNSIGQTLLPERSGFDCGGACTGSRCCAGVATGWIGIWEYKQGGGGGPILCDNFRQLVVVKEGCASTLFSATNYSCFSNGTFLIQDSPFGTTACVAPMNPLLGGNTQACIVDGSFGNDNAIVQCPNDARCDLRCTTCINGACSYCMTGYYLQTSTCAACATHCDECSSGTQCTTCSDGYYINANGGCTACNSSCSLCDSATVCTDCIVGYRLNGTRCEACTTANCTQCDVQDICFDCTDGNVFNPVNNSCVYLPPNVTQYTFDPLNGTLIVTRCNNGYYVDSPPRRCVECPAGCARCDSATVCTRCDANAYADATGTCKTCDSAIKYCADCDLRGTVVWCNACVEGKGFVNEPQKCASCSSGYHCDQCLSYNYNPKTGCLSCKDGYSWVIEHPNLRCYADGSAATLLHPSVFFGVVMMALATYLL